MRFWVFCYDISDDHTRREVAELLADAGAHRVQESVFEGWFGSRDIASLYAALRPRFTEASDRLRAYPVPAPGAGRRTGQGVLPLAPHASSHWVC